MMRLTSLVALLAVTCARPGTAGEQDGWITLFDGKSLEGWKINEDHGLNYLEDGKIKAHGPRAHIFYAGPVKNHNFKDFELKLEVMTTPGSNSGVYFHTKFQEKGWPSLGYEAQVNCSQKDWRKGGSLYAVKDIRESPGKDNEWWEYHIIVKGKTITLKVNGKTTVEYTEPENVDRNGRKLSSGTIALQCHDPKSVVYYRNIRIKPLD